MYLTFEQALKIIKSDTAKNPNYHMTRIRMLINEGKLIEAKPDIYIKDDSGEFICLGKICTERLVTEESVLKYAKIRESKKKKYGRIPKPNRPVKVVFSDNSNSYFDSIEDACRFFDLKRSQVMRSIRKNKPIEIPVHTSRVSLYSDITVEDNIKTELVRFF